MSDKKMQRFLVRKNPGQKTVADVFAWNEQLAARRDLEEVWAEDVKSALTKGGVPDPKNISLSEIERMSKDDLITFAKVRLGLSLDAALSKSELQDEVKVAIFMPRTDAPAEAAASIPEPDKMDRPRARAI